MPSIAERRADALLVAGSALLTAAVFWPALRNGFVVSWDDGGFVVGNEAIRHLGTAARAAVRDFEVHFDVRYWAPLTLLSLALDHLVWGLEPFGYHLTSVLLHAANASLAALVARALIARSSPDLRGIPLRLAAAAAALLWSLHPLRVEAVAWVSDRKSSLAMLFALGGVLAHLRHVEAGRPWWRSRWFAATFALGAGSILSKPSLVTLPAVFVLLDLWPLRRPEALGSAALLEKVPLLAVAAAATWFTMDAHAASGFGLVERPLGARALVALRSVVDYLRLTVWPLDLSPFYLYPGVVGGAAYLVPALLVVAVTGLAAWRWRSAPAPATAWLAFLVLLAPGLMATQVSDTAMADRFTYLPALPLAILVGAGIVRSARSRGRAVVAGTGVATAAVLAALASLTVTQIGVWRDDVTLWSRPIEVAPGISGRVYAQRSAALERAGDIAGARADLDVAVAIAEAKAFAGRDELILHRASLAVGAGDGSAAVEDVRRSLEAARPGRRPVLLERAAAMLRDAGLDREAAVVELEFGGPGTPTAGGATQ